MYIYMHMNISQRNHLSLIIIIYIYKFYFIIPYSVSQLISHENIQTVLPLQEYSLNNTENITVNTRLVAQQASWSNTHKNLAISQIVQG